MPILITGLFAPSGGADAFNLVSWHDVANHNFVATDPPGVDNDLNDASEPTNPEGYRVGSFWCDIVHGKVYVCLDPADGAAVWVEITAVGGTGGGLSGIDFSANGDPLCFAAALGLQEGTGVWVSGTCVGGEASYTMGAYPTALPTSISGVDLKLENGLVCFARALDFHQGTGIWISGTCAGQEGEFTFGAYPAAAAPTSISGVDVLVRDGEVCFARALDFHEGSGVWISGTCSGPEATVEVGAYPTAAPPTSISGVDARLDGGPVCFARAFDFHQTGTVWISGSCSGQEADFTFGAYPSAAGGTSISGVDAKVENAALCFARAFDFHAGTGLWVSGSCANQEAEITFGALGVDRVLSCYINPDPASATALFILGPIPYDYDFVKVSLKAPDGEYCNGVGGSAQIVDIERQTTANKNTHTTATIFATAGNRPQIANGQNCYGETTTFDTPSGSDGDFLYVISAQYGAGITGLHVSVTIRPK